MLKKFMFEGVFLYTKNIIKVFLPKKNELREGYDSLKNLVSFKNLNLLPDSVFPSLKYGIKENKNNFNSFAQPIFIGFSTFDFFSFGKNFDNLLKIEKKLDIFKKKDSENILVFRNCESPSDKLISNVSESLLFSEPSMGDKIRLTSLINRWYKKENYFFSKICFEEKSLSKLSKVKIIEGFEPKIRKIKFSPKEEKKNLGFFGCSKVRLSVLKKILKIDTGSKFQWQPEIWEKKFKGDLFDNGKINIQSFKIAEKYDFLDLFIEMDKIPTKKIEPEILISNQNLSGSFSFYDSNLFGSGMILQNKISRDELKIGTFQFDLFSHFQNSGKLTIIKKNKKERKKLTLGITKNLKNLLESSFNFNLEKRKNNLKAEKRFTFSLFLNKFRIGDKNFYSQNLIVSSVQKNKLKNNIELGFFFETKKNFTTIFNDFSNFKMRFVNFSHLDFRNLKESVISISGFREKKNSFYSEKFNKNFRKETIFEVNANVRNQLSSFIFFELKKSSNCPNLLKKNLHFGLNFKNLLSFHLILTGDGRKKILISMN